MIARIWSAQSTPALAPAYAEHLRRQVLPVLRKVNGYLGARLLERGSGGKVEIIVLTFWESLDLIKGFAGDDPESAVVADEAAALLTQFDRSVAHYQVVVSDGM